MDCVPDTSYLSSPDFLALVMHILTSIEIPLHLFGGWVILFRTPSTMSSVKTSMLNLHFWSAFLDVSISLLTCPVVLFPSVAGYTMGVLSMLGVTDLVQIHLVLTSLGIVINSMLSVYENRYFIMSSRRNAWSRYRKTFLVASYLVMSTYLIPFTMMSPEQTEAKKAVFSSLPCLPPAIYGQNVFVYTLDMIPVFVTVSVLFSAQLSAILTFVTLTLRVFLGSTRRGTFSQKTISLQKKFLFGLIIQTTIPIFVIFCPTAYILLSVPRGYHNQTFNNFAFITFSLHGLLSTLAMLLIHTPYRRATLNVFMPCHTPKVSKSTVWNASTASFKV